MIINLKNVLRPRLSFFIFLQLIVLWFSKVAIEAKSIEAASNSLSFFHIILSAPEANRMNLSMVVYRKEYRHANSITAMRNLDSLEIIAQKLGDKSLECQVFDFRADYFSVNNGFNLLSQHYYQQAIDFAEKNNMPVETGYRLHRMGLFYKTFKKNTLACRYFLLSQEKFREIGYKNVPDISIYLSETAAFYYALGDYETAKSNLLDALRYNKGSVRDIISSTNTVGLIYRSYKQYPLALTYFEKALKLAITSKDSVWVGIVNGNIGSVYFMEKLYDKALPLINADYQTSIKYNDPINGTIALLRLVKIDMAGNQNTAAAEKLNKAEQLLKNTKQDALSVWADFYELKALESKKDGDASGALNYTQKFMSAKDSLAKRDNMAAVERVRLGWELERHTAQLNKLKGEEELLSLRRNTVIAFLFLLVVIILLIYNQQRIKSQKEKELLNAEKQRVDEELKNAALELERYTQNLKQNNKLLEKVTAEVELLQSRSADEAVAVQLEALKAAHIMTDESWGDFKQLFGKVHKNFFFILQKKHPHLSQTDTRMLSLVKLKLNNREMAGMLGITVEGIKKAKQRLRKKMDLPANIDIENILDDL